MKKNNVLGKTGKFPEGKICEHDEGELRIAIGISDKCVVLDFGTPITWIGLPKKQAMDLAELILKKAGEL